MLRAKDSTPGWASYFTLRALVFSFVKEDDNLLLGLVLRARGPRCARRPAEHRKAFLYVLAV